MKKTPKQFLSERIVDRIIKDISDRSGFGDAWADTDKDIQEEIKREWRLIIVDEVTK